MSDFIVSARKYRPATFASVVGQKHITSTLKNAIERGQLAHAYLFCGPRGVGKTTCARIFAKAINCLNPNGSEACNECESCRSFNEGRSLNIHELDAASNNSVEDIRTLIEQVRIIPQVGRYSVFIIDEVHMLSAAAFNAFLKTLEEPPAHAIFILATTEKHKIIPTILSRCQIYDFNRIRVEDGVEYLKYIASQEGIAADEESLNLIAQKADGGMRDALSMFDKAVSFCGKALDYRNVAQTLNVLDYDTYFGVTEMLLAGNYVDTLVTFDSVLSRGFSGQTFMAGLNRHMRDLLMAKRPETLRLIEMTGTLLERYRTQAGACDVEFLFGAISCLTEEHYFQGSSAYLTAIRQVVSLPVLRKDFLFDAYQVYEAAAIGADAVLLIAAVLPPETLAELYRLAYSLGLEVLVEVHNQEELEQIAFLEPQILGVNNRNLKTFEVSLDTVAKLKPFAPEQGVFVSESGIRNNADMQMVRQLGADAVLIGETLMRSDDIAGTLHQLREGV